MGAGEGVLGAHPLVVEQAEQGRVGIPAQIVVGLNVAGEGALLLKPIQHTDEPTVEVAVV